MPIKRNFLGNRSNVPGQKSDIKLNVLPNEPLVITCTYENGGGQTNFQFNRKTNAIEIAGIAMTMLQSQIAAMAKAIIQFPVQINRDEPHQYLINEQSEKSARGFACGVCGKDDKDEIHAVLLNETENPLEDLPHGA